MADKRIDNPTERGFKSEARRVFSEFEYPHSIAGTIVREMKDGVLLKTPSGTPVAYPVAAAGAALSMIIALSLSDATFSVSGEANQSPIAHGLDNAFGYLAIQKTGDTSLVVVRDGTEYRVFEMTQKNGQAEMTYISDSSKAFFELAQSLERLRQYSSYLTNIGGQLPPNPPVLQQFDYVSTLYRDPDSQAMQRGVNGIQNTAPTGSMQEYYSTYIRQLEGAAAQIRDGHYGFGGDSLPRDTQQMKEQEKIGFIRPIVALGILGAGGMLALGLPIGLIRSGSALRRRSSRKPE